MLVISAQSWPEGRDHRQVRRHLFPRAGRTTLTSLVTLAAAVIVAAVLPLTAGAAAGAATSSTAWAQIAAGAVHTCGVSTSHTLSCWGNNAFGQLGIGSTALSEDLPQPVTTPAATGWDSVTAGGKGEGGQTCAIRTGHKLWCWGEGGLLGIGNDFNQDLPQQVTTPSATGWATVSAGAFHTCATRTDGTLWCWGDNGAGRLGIGNTVTQELPQQVTTPAATGWATVTAGGAHTCATRTDTTLWCWGSNLTGQLGIGSSTITSEHLPQQVTTPSASGWAAVTAGDSHTCATQTDQTLWCWGYNNSGQVGIGSTAPNANLPQQVTTPAATGWATISAGGFHSCATRTDGTLWCWGANYDGQLGIGSSGSKRLPQQVAKSATTPWAAVSAGGLHSCATRTNRTLWCWGSNNSGELGIGNTTIQYRPQRVTA